MSSNRKKVNSLVGKIGWCDGPTLGLSKGHYVFVRRVYGKNCSVNTFTSIARTNGTYDIRKIKMVEDGCIYPIPGKDTSLRRFGGVHKNVIKNVPISSIQNVGSNSVKRRHHHYIQKYMK